MYKVVLWLSVGEYVITRCQQFRLVDATVPANIFPRYDQADGRIATVRVSRLQHNPVEFNLAAFVDEAGSVVHDGIVRTRQALIGRIIVRVPVQ